MLLVLFVFFLSVTYGKWECLTYLHGKEFRPPVEAYQNRSHSWLGKGAIKQLKIFKYTEKDAEIFIEDSIDNKWLFNFYKDRKDQWTIYRDENTVQIEIIDSKMGGSADRFFYWY